MKISIPTPCEASWQEMKPETSGRFCSSCEKTVVDFTSMNKTQIENYFLQKAQQKTCGRFLKTQLLEDYSSFNSLQIRYLKAIKSKRTWKTSLSIAIISFGMFITSCEKPNTNIDFNLKYDNLTTYSEIIQEELAEIKEEKRQDSIRKNPIKIEHEGIKYSTMISGNIMTSEDLYKDNTGLREILNKFKKTI